MWPSFRAIPSACACFANRSPLPPKLSHVSRFRFVPLMRALSKLIYLHNPDLVLFVGEALVGNDAVDQLSKFNQKLADLSTSPTHRLIDGILSTKFDTVDDNICEFKNCNFLGITRWFGNGITT
ncbi:Signal recognition particle receptor subunit alpha-like [Spatholobus suberectus]|nr:Signal recognition particle receptor subunit alpha-like [Spatholobus suberectus]